MSKTHWVNFLTNKSKTYFANIDTATISLKYTTVGTTKQNLKSSQIITEMNAHIEHTFTVLNAFFSINQYYENFHIACFV